MLPTWQPVMVGTSLPRQDGPDKITGRVRYAGDQVLPGMLYARLVLSPYAHARILKIDTSFALTVPGVVAVFTAEMLGMAQADTLSRAQSPLAVHEVVWCGHPVAIVVGETEASAEDGATAVEVDYEPLPAVIDPETIMKADSSLEKSSSQIPPLKTGDIESGLREAEVVVECSYRTHPVHQSYMEPQSVTVAPSSSGHQLVIWPSTQGMFNVRSAVANALKMPERQIRVEPVPIGGGFGGKETLIEPLVATVASHLRKPLRLVYTRQEDLLAGNPAPQTVMSVKLGAK
ncbi:MAG TPA: molybdopterin cofactor-binding domain-containing protein, partial [Ktedonobacteraceae bacterium]|nr:molybdopterin cofactor-binding domain-containing protein [Ktedonobacteraceae bacterium]